MFGKIKDFGKNQMCSETIVKCPVALVIVMVMIVLLAGCASNSATEVDNAIHIFWPTI